MKPSPLTSLFWLAALLAGAYLAGALKRDVDWCAALEGRVRLLDCVLGDEFKRLADPERKGAE